MLRAFIAAACVCGLVTGCGGDEGEQGTTGGPTEAPPEETESPPNPMVCAGSGHTCALNASGAVFCWGANLNGELGDGTRQSRWAPVPVVGVSDARQIACGNAHTCALRNGGVVSCWGSNSIGQLGAGNTDIQLSPVEVSGLSDAVEVDVGWDYSCARTSGGTVSCWGYASEGRLGAGVRENQSSPTAIAAISDATDLAVGNGQSCVITSGGTMQCWGANGFGQRGHAGSGVGAVPGLTGVTAMGLGNSFTCASHSGGVSCWGYDRYGQLGNGPEEEDRSAEPVEVQGLPGTVTQMDGGSEYICARIEDGRLYCWGRGQTMPAEARDDQETAMEVAGISGVTQVAAGSQHACVLTGAGALTCWGSSSTGALGNGERHSRTPVAIANISEISGEASTPAAFVATDRDEPIATAIAVGRDSVCGVVPDGRVSCFGSALRGRLGNGSERPAVDAQTPSYVHGITDARQVDNWSDAACVVRANHTIACWGDLPVTWNNRDLEASSLPIPIPGMTDAVEVAVGQTSICARRESGAVSCFGSGNSGQLGNGANQASDAWVEVTGLTDAVQLSIGNSTVCARREGGTVMCWGSNQYGILGNGSDESRSNVPVEVAGLSGATDISVDYYSACAAAGGRVSCWGRNNVGQLGNGSMADDAESNRPVQVRGVSNAVRVAVRHSAACAVTEAGEAFCWGQNNAGQLGLADDEPNIPSSASAAQVARETNEDVTAFGPYVTYAPGLSFTCGVHTSGNVSCSGSTVIRRGGGFTGIGALRSRAPVAAASFAVVPVPSEPEETPAE